MARTQTPPTLLPGGYVSLFFDNKYEEPIRYIYYHHSLMMVTDHPPCMVKRGTIERAMCIAGLWLGKNGAARKQNQLIRKPSSRLLFTIPLGCAGSLQEMRRRACNVGETCSYHNASTTLLKAQLLS